jgi:3-isopropylmalate/(R)-2-methylmalate dehydratase large subunit
MGMTITEKILARHAGLNEVKPGQLINAEIDLALGNDITAPISVKAFKEAGASELFDKEKIVLVLDHFTPNKDIKSAEQCKLLREFSQEQGVAHFYDVGRMGVEHALLPEEGLVVPGELIIGADSHTCTYGALGAFATGVGSTDFAAAMITGELWFKVPQSMKFEYSGKLQKWVSGKDLILYTIGQIGVDGALYRAMEFCGETIEQLSMDSRLAMANMAIEAGGKNGIVAPDQVTMDYLKGRSDKEPVIYESDPDAIYVEEHSIDASAIEPQVAMPHLPENAEPVSKVEGVKIDQAVIGSCTNGRLEDLREAAEVLKGRKANQYVRLIVIPATQKIYRQAMDEGLFAIFMDAGAVISTPTCGPCLGGHMGILAAGERSIATTNRNFRGRMGHPDSEVYLSNAALAAAAAVAGRICHPDNL